MAPDSEYKCTICASDDLTTIRQDRENPRLKCNKCHFTFNGKDASEASAAGAIQPSSPELLAQTGEPEKVDQPARMQSLELLQHTGPRIFQPGIPKLPAYLFVSKDRLVSEVCTKRDFKKVAIRWQDQGSFDIYELKKLKINVKVNIA